MTDALKRLSDEGVSIWLDDLSRKRIDVRQPRRARSTSSTWSASPPTRRSSRTRSAAATATSSSSPTSPRAASRVDEAVRMITTADVRDAADILRPVYDATGGQDGRVSIEVDPRLAHDTAATIAEAKQLAWLVDRPNIADQDPGDQGGPARDHRGHRPGHQRQRHADLLAGALPRGHGRLPGRPGEGQGRGPGPLADPLGGLLLRLPRGHRDRQAAGRARHRRGQAPSRARPALANARLAYQAYEEVFAGERWAALGRRRRQQAAPAVGLDRRQGPGVQGHPVRRRAGRARTRSTPCRRPPWRPPPTTATSPATP